MTEPMESASPPLLPAEANSTTDHGIAIATAAAAGADAAPPPPAAVPVDASCDESAEVPAQAAPLRTRSLSHSASSPSLLEPSSISSSSSSTPAMPAAASDVHESSQPVSTVEDVSSSTPTGATAAAAEVAPTNAKPTRTHSGSSLRIFSLPTDDLALKAILSPPTNRTTRPSTAASASTTESPSLGARTGQSAASFAGSLLEQTSRLFFPRGNSGASSTSSPELTSVVSERSQSSTVEPVPAPSAAAAALGPPPPPAPLALPKTRSATASIAIEDDVARVNSDVVVVHPNLPPPPFANMFTCETCREDIGSLLSQGRHHCRNCGGSFCAACSSKFIMVPYQLYLAKGVEQRVCDGCYNRIRDFHAQTQTTDVTWSGLRPPSNAAFAELFALPPHETPVTIFNCSYFVDFAPHYGHLFMTRRHVCFHAYTGRAQVKIAFADLHALIKPEFYYINALQINTKARREKHFFAEFNGLRDLCFLRLDQLIRAFQAGRKHESSLSVTAEELVQQAMVRRRSYKILAHHVSSQHHHRRSRSKTSTPPQDLATFMAGATTGFVDVDDDEEDGDESDSLSSERRRSSYSHSVATSLNEEDDDDDNEDDDGAGGGSVDDDVDADSKSTGTSSSIADSSSSSSSDDEPFVPLTPDQPLTKMTTLLDCELRADVRRVFELFWSNGDGQQFLRKAMERVLDIDIEIEAWRPMDMQNEELTKGFVVSKESDYALYRYVRSQHPPKTKFPGLPPYASCCRLQRVRVEYAGGATAEHETTVEATDSLPFDTTKRWQRFVVSDLHRMSKIPFSDYFEIETRWVFSRDGKNYCHVQAGLVVNFLKSTWFKSQINSSTVAESREVFEDWAKLAILHIQEMPGSIKTSARQSTAEKTAKRAEKRSSKAAATVASAQPSSAQSPAPSSVTRSSSSSEETRNKSPSSVGSSSFAAAGKGESSVAVSAATQQQQRLAVGPLTLLWVLVLALLFYGVLLIRAQHAQLQKLTETTAVLLEKVQRLEATAAASNSAPLSPQTLATLRPEDAVCAQSVVRGAVEALVQFFRSSAHAA